MDYEERQAIRMRHVTMTFSAPMTMAELIDRIAAHDDASASAIILRLIRKGLKVERDEREQAAKGQK